MEFALREVAIGEVQWPIDCCESKVSHSKLIAAEVECFYLHGPAVISIQSRITQCSECSDSQGQPYID